MKNNAILFTGSLIAATLNYLYYPVLGRLMDVEHFGEVQTLVSIFLQVAIFMTVATIVVTNIVANKAVKKEEYQALGELERFILLIAVSFLTLALLFVEPIRAFFQFDTGLPFVALALAILVSVPLTLRAAFLRGLLRFKEVSTSAIVSAGFKLFFSAALVLFGWQTFGAITGIAFAQLIALAYTAKKARQAGRFPHSRSGLRLPAISTIKPQLKYAGFVTVITLLVTLQFSIDMLVVKHYFDPQAAGLYAGITAVARILFFLTASISAVLLASVQLSDKSGNNRLLLIRSSTFLLLLGGMTLLFFMLFPDLVIHVLVGSRYGILASLLPKLSLAVFIVSVANLVLTYAMGLRLYSVIMPVVIGAAATYLLLFFNHATLSDVVSSILYGSISMLGFVAVWALAQAKRIRLSS